MNNADPGLWIIIIRTGKSKEDWISESGNRGADEFGFFNCPVARSSKMVQK
jgi:hypothetical protein